VSVYTHPLQDDEPFLLHKDFGKVRVLRLFRQLFVAAVRVVASGQQQWEMMCCAWDVVRVCARAHLSHPAIQIEALGTQNDRNGAREERERTVEVAASIAAPSGDLTNLSTDPSLSDPRFCTSTAHSQ
jgi:hypothetical protein